MSRSDIHIGLVSSGAFAHLDEDLPLLVAALDALGVPSTIVDWHDDAFDWSAVDLAVIRSPWDYTWQLDAFLAWAEAVTAVTRLANPVDVIRWNTDKRYLVTLDRLGVPVIPTEVLEPGDEPTFPVDSEFVVKPVVSAGARDTERYQATDAGHIDAAVAHVSRLHHAGRAVLVQPYVPGIDTHGETGMVYVGDAFSHAFRKGAILTPDAAFVEGLYREEEITPRTPSDAELHLAEATLDAVSDALTGIDRTDLLYARVDLAPGPDGPSVMELELVEPSLFLRATTDPALAAARAAAAFDAAAHHAVQGRRAP